jgi:hypothetical protein
VAPFSLTSCQANCWLYGPARVSLVRTTAPAVDVCGCGHQGSSYVALVPPSPADSRIPLCRPMSVISSEHYCACRKVCISPFSQAGSAQGWWARISLGDSDIKSFRFAGAICKNRIWIRMGEVSMQPWGKTICSAQSEQWKRPLCWGSVSEDQFTRSNRLIAWFIRGLHGLCGEV